MTTILRRVVTAAAIVATAGLLSAPAAFAGGEHGGGGGRTILRAELAGSLTTDPVLFGTTPGGADWVIGDGEARLRQNGRLDVRVEGLVLTSTGANPVPQLAASIACNGTVVVTTAIVPFSPTGDAVIHARVALPERCIAPVVLLNPRGNAAVYIGVTGTEA
ncbi:hypothetical protein HP550_10070 [Cellulomonas humilata]|uniref:Uncharacterized protein n=1 Tax=Cellulomonas humilata TaxID=144055 RepID=A0A7Y6A2S9_9CELL|nr:hypothetical protein [Cellulomonas humilata]NUU17597.1 hypothetical protein [Cellulomonas humilata]